MDDERVGTVIGGRYLLEGVVGEEFAGRVYLARDTSRGKRVRLKLMRSTANDEKFRRFQREIEAFARVRSPGLLPLLDSGVHEGLSFAVFPGLAERTLQDLVAEGRLEPRRATELVARLAVGLGALHRDGITHRDLVATNVLVDDKDEVHVRDLGLASFVSVDDATDRLTRADDRVGHVASMAPEYIESKTAEPAADLYALGILAFQLLTGRPPFPGSAKELLHQHLKAIPPAPSTLAPAVPEWLDALVLALLEKDADARPAPDVVVARIRKGWEAAAPPRRRLPVAPVLGALGVALLVAGGVTAWRSGWLKVPEPPHDDGLVATSSARLPGPAEPEGELTELWLLPPEEPQADVRVFHTSVEARTASAKGPQVRTGLLEVHANRRVLVTLDGRALGYSPLRASVPIGPHELTAALPARKDTTQARRVVIEESAPEALSLLF